MELFMNKLRLIVMMLILPTILFGFFEDEDENKAAILQVPKKERHIKISVVTPKPVAIPISQMVIGVTQPRKTVTISALTEGILHLHKCNAQRVKKGSTIATIYNKQREISIKSLHATVTLLKQQIANKKKRLQSTKEMLKLGIVSKDQFLQEQNLLQEKKIAYYQAKTKLNKLKLQHEISVVKAPKDGYIENILPEGSYINYGQTICKIIDSNTQIRLFVPISLAKTLYVGQKVTISAEGILDEAKITAILPKSSNNLINVIAIPSYPLPNGLHIEAKIQTSQAKGWIVPKEAIVLVQNRPALFLIKNNKASLRFITVQKDMIDKVLVTDHLNADDKIALKNAYMLHDGAIVEIGK